ncbi:MAG: acetate/propionate family kinase [Dokdonella sp.]
MSPTPDMSVLALNAGSSSLKFGVYRVGACAHQRLLGGMSEIVDGQHGAFSVTDAEGRALDGGAQPPGTPQAVVARIADLLSAHGLPAPGAIGHRIVHGGAQCRDHSLIDIAVMQQLEAAKAFAPLHVPPALALIQAAQERFPGIAQVACLDTAFHASMPDLARTLPIPRELRERGIERYGFHGLACESIVRQLGDAVPQRLLIAHLGNGASVTAVANGRSIDTSMGLTPSGGVIMSTRCGDIDPGVLAYVVRELGYDATQLEALIDQRAGLRGISGIGGDMRQLHAAAESNPDARLAIAMFCYSVRKQIGAMAAALGGVDLLVFSGGIGENDAAIRSNICDGLGALGIDGPAETGKHGEAGPKASLTPSTLHRSHGAIRVMPAEEDEQIVRHTWQLATHPRARGSAVADRSTF